MIPQSLSFICQGLNTFIKHKYSLQEDMVLLSNIVNQDGSITTESQNRIVMTLVNISEDVKTMYSAKIPKLNPQGKMVTPNTPYNCHVLFVANFSGESYLEGIKMVSDIINYFQYKPFFDKLNDPGLEGVDRIGVELLRLNLEEISHLWSFIGAKQMPSVSYQLRMMKMQ